MKLMLSSLQRSTIWVVATATLISQMAGDLSAADFYTPSGFSNNVWVLSLGVLAGEGPAVVGSTSTAEEIFPSLWEAGQDAQPIAHLPGNNRTVVQTASDDLGVMFGSSWFQAGPLDNQETLFRWTAEEGLVSLGSLRDEDAERWLQTTAADTTPDGSTLIVTAGIGRSVVGSTVDDGIPPVAFHWTGQKGLRQIADGRAVAVSDDGQVVIGDSDAGVFRWTEEAGPETLTSSGRAAGLSADGSVVVGWTDGIDGREAFRWTLEDGIELHGLPPGRSRSYAHAVSSDGAIVVGTTSSDDEDSFVGDEIFRWSSGEGMLVLERPENSTLSGSPLASESGDTIVTNIWSGGYSPAIWRYGRGTELLSLRDVLVDEFGLSDQLGDLNLGRVTSISPDGMTIAGVGCGPALRDGAHCAASVWVATIPEPGAATLMLIGCLALEFRRARIRSEVPHVSTRG